MNKGTRPGEQNPAGGVGGASRAEASKMPAPSANETVAGDVSMGAGRARTGGSSDKKQKVCCSCGKNVAHEERFKDRSGYYWCMDCGVQENRKNHVIGHKTDPVKCPDCSQTFPPEQIVEHEGTRLCAGCAEKRTQHAKREATRDAHRKAAALEAALEESRHRRRVLIGSAVAAVLALAWALYVVAS